MFPPLVYTPKMLTVGGLLALTIGGVSGALPGARIVRLVAAEALFGALHPQTRSSEILPATHPGSAAVHVVEQGDITLTVMMKANQSLLR